jgi:hypothetical protein
MVKIWESQALRRLFLALLVLGLAAVGSTRIQQYVVRYRANILLEDIRAVDVGRSTFADTQALFHRWKQARNTGPCTTAQCDFEISVGDFAFNHGDWIKRHPTIVPAIFR